MTARLLVVGFDAAEATLVASCALLAACRRWLRCAIEGCRSRMEPRCMDRRPGAIWQDIGMGVSAIRHGDDFPDRLHTGEAVGRDVDPTQHAADHFWARAAAGHKLAVIDHPLAHRRGLRAGSPPRPS